MSVFNFKRFSVDQTGCAMKINTDGVLLGALAEADEPENILDIGAGTGVIALMLAQRFDKARIKAVEIDEGAAETARINLKDSPFADRMEVIASGFEAYFINDSKVKYDLIVSNPPFFLNSLASPGYKKNLARHTNAGFYEVLIRSVAEHLTKAGTCQLILPLPTAGLVKDLLPAQELSLQKEIAVHSFKDDEPHRKILIFGKKYRKAEQQRFIIYDKPKVYSAAYQNLLRDFFTIF